MATPVSQDALREAERNYQAYDFKNDPDFQIFAQHAVAVQNTDDARDRLQRVYYRRRVDNRILGSKEAVDAMLNREKNKVPESEYARPKPIPTYDPGDIRQAEREALRKRQEREQQNSASSTTNPSNSNTENISMRNRAKNLVTRCMNFIQEVNRKATKYYPEVTFALNALVVLASFRALFFSTLGLYHYSGASYAFLSAIASYVFALSRSFGTTNHNQELVRKLAQADESHYMAFCVIGLMATPPVSVMFIPLLVYSVFNCANFLQYMARRNPTLEHKIGNILQRLFSFQTQAIMTSASFEIWIMPTLLFLGFRAFINILLLFPYLHFLRFRYICSAYSKAAWSSMDQRITPWAHQYLPVSVVSIYDKIRSKIIEYGHP